LKGKSSKAQSQKRGKKAGKSSGAKKHSGWPAERQVFFRPGRKKYVLKENRESGCVFCKTADGEPAFENLCVYKSGYSQIVLNKFPYNNGHVLVLPLRHCGDLLKLSPNEYADLHQTLRLAVEAVQKVYAPNGLNLGMNHGASAGAGIPEHLHYHIVPRWSGDVNFCPLIAETKVVIESLEDSYKRFADYFINLA
jgi:ATP adenylyltransferase